MAKNSKDKEKKIEQFKQLFGVPYFRLTNLYHIIDKTGHKVLFKPNWAQQQLWENIWYCNIILKARQLGISTFICILFLDKCLWNTNLSCGIIADTQANGEKLFLKIKFAYDNLMPEIKSRITANNDTAQMLRFSNGSSIYVGTSLRSTTVQYLHISEFGKICAKYPDKAREVITGSLNTLAVGQYCFIESTAEGREGYFYDMCIRARADQLEKRELSKINFKFHFFPWWGQPEYKLGSCPHMTQEHHDYFNTLLSKKIQLTQEQKNWYIDKSLYQKDDMKREYPSTPEEAWEVSNEGTYYGRLITLARIENRISSIKYDDSLLVHTAWDLGLNDFNAIWYFQLYGREIRLIEYEQGHNISLEEWIKKCKDKPYQYGIHLAPHDIKVKEYSTGISRIVVARQLQWPFLCVPKNSKIAGIDNVRTKLNNCYFDKDKCSEGIRCLENYKKEWDDTTGDWKKEPYHNWASHGADAFRCLCEGMCYITGRMTDEEKSRDELERARDPSGLLPGHFLYMPDTKDKFKDPLRNQGQRHSIF